MNKKILASIVCAGVVAMTLFSSAYAFWFGAPVLGNILNIFSGSSSVQSSATDVFSMGGTTTNKKMNMIVTEDMYIPVDYGNIYGLSTDAKISFGSDSGLVRFVLVNGDMEYLIYDAYPKISGNGVTINNGCEETCALDGVSGEYIRVEVFDATVEIDSFNVIETSDDMDDNAKKSGVKSYNTQRMNEQNQYKIKKLNANDMDWVAGSTSVSAMTYHEKKTLFRDYYTENGKLPNLQGFEFYVGGIFELEPSTASALAASSSTDEQVSVESDSLPGEWDWRNRHGENWITSVKNQGACGSCWDFAATGATEALVNLYFNQHINMDLSEQDTLSCSGAGTCGGGSPMGAADYIKTTGVVEEACFKYNASDLPCDYKCSEPQETVKIGGRGSYFYASQGEDAMKDMIINYGAVTGVVSSWNHAMEIVGYGTIKVGDLIYFSTSYSERKTIAADDPLIGEPYWIFKNSWGPNWGESGFCKINLPLREFQYSFGIYGPVTTKNSYEIACVDKDNDTYCNWGISATKPASCPSYCMDVPDCDDSDANMAGFDAMHNCIDISTCTDSDDGLDYYTAGEIFGNTGAEITYDYCINSTLLRETYCENDAGASDIYTCPVMCIDGACVDPTCSDSDDGKDYYVKGEITGYMADSSEKYDYCLDETTLRETYCDGNLGYSEIYVCPGICSDGKCVDITPPTVQITYPIDGTNIIERFLTVTADVSTNTLLADFYVDDAYIGSDSTLPISYKFKTTPYDGQTVTIKVIARADGGATAEDAASVFIGYEPVPVPECNDGKDNDGDGLCDWNGCAKNKAIWYEPDPDCDGQDDSSESS